MSEPIQPDPDPWATQDGPPGLSMAVPADWHERIGRYRIEKVLGEGAFGRVYLARDEQLDRLVAIKVPRRERLRDAEEMEAYLAEARVLARLDHPNIVPVHDFGTTEDGACYVVSKVIEGSDLAGLIKEARLAPRQAAELTSKVADALHHAHNQGLVHRDVKPANILIDGGGRPYVADFGLALREADFGKGAGFAGTPAYMSPEQARGEGHRVDGRSDIFSLGVVFYELLTGRRPFHGQSQAELLEMITNIEARPPRQVDDTVPKELERICLKALSKRATERYTAACDLADDLRHWLDGTDVSATRTAQSGIGGAATGSGVEDTVLAASNTADARPIKIVPKGLRSFDSHDAAFFLELLAGPRDRNGLPDSLAFWKTRIEETDAENTFAVGLIYGPSGCGKTSLVKAGLLPRLADQVLVVYVEATARETEARLLNGLRKRCPALPVRLTLTEILTSVRRGQGIAPGRKLLIVLDQFEQWLHANQDQLHAELVQALRQCDGERIQCVVMVRDDFWMAVTRFLTHLEVELVQGKNFAAIDLFDVRHAEKVLWAFGHAFGRLPDVSSALNKEQQQFLTQAVAGLTQEGLVICVRLALFAEMMKSKPWTPASLQEVGGAQGVGATFLEGTFCSPAANPKHRLHEAAARAVLKALLPDSGTDIKGHMRSHAELLEASGYAKRVLDFDELIRILDREIRLITPTDPEGKVGLDETMSQVLPGERYYQLTHDYLVHSLRDWLTHKQKETRRGRAELLLADRTAVWSARPETRQLPTLWQWLRIRSLTEKKNWTPAQRTMMQSAFRYHTALGVIVGLGLLAVCLVAMIAIIRRDRANHFEVLLETVRSSDDAGFVLAAIEELQRDYDYGADQVQELIDGRNRDVLRGALFEHAKDLVPGQRARGRLLLARAFLKDARKPVDFGAVVAVADEYILRNDAEVLANAQKLRGDAEAGLRKQFGPPPTDKLQWVKIKGGKFLMGCDLKVEEREDALHKDELPLHQVTVGDFEMLRCEVTVAEFRCFVPTHPGKDPTHAAGTVNWYAAYAFAAWHGGRLPTEAEWEYACRAGSQTAYCCGNTEEDAVGWYDSNTRIQASGIHVQPTGAKKPNAWGLHDMHGNVREWVIDWYGPYPKESQADPLGPEYGRSRVVRSGSYMLGSQWARSPSRFHLPPLTTYEHFGVRIVRTGKLSG